MADGTHDVVVWVGTKPGEKKLFTITARDADGNVARMEEVEEQVADAKFVEVRRVTGLTKARSIEVKREWIAEYKRNGFRKQPRKALPQKMRGG